MKNSWKKHEVPEHKNLHFCYTRLILDVKRPLVNHWSPLTYASHCMTTSRPAAATQMSESKASHAPQGIFMPDALPAATLTVSGLRICSLSYPRKLLNVINNSRLTALPFVKIVMHTVKTCVYSYKQGRIMAYNIEGTYERWLHSILNMYVSQSITMVLCIASTELSILHWNINLAIWCNDLIWIHKEIIVITIDLAWFSSLFSKRLCVFGLHGAVY